MLWLVCLKEVPFRWIYITLKGKEEILDMNSLPSFHFLFPFFGLRSDFYLLCVYRTYCSVIDWSWICLTFSTSLGEGFLHLLWLLYVMWQIVLLRLGLGISVPNVMNSKTRSPLASKYQRITHTFHRMKARNGRPSTVQVTLTCYVEVQFPMSFSL